MNDIKKSNNERSVAAFGNFSGMHKGHLAVIEKLKEESEKRGVKSLVISHPETERIFTTENEKKYFIQNIGVDYFESVDEKITAKMLADYNTEAVIMGDIYDDHSFEDELNSLGIEVIKVAPVRDETGTVISSEMTEHAFDEDDFERYENLCGHKYIMIGTVVHGKALGRTVGMPTANLGVSEKKAKPNDGVYGTNVIVDDEMFTAMTNIGKRPSVDNFDYTTIEAFILDFNKDIYDKEIVLEVFKKVRGVIKFENLEAVKTQVDKDIKFIRDYKADKNI